MKFGVLILGSDINAYNMARCYHELYARNPDVMGKKAIGVFKYSKIINFIDVPKIEQWWQFIAYGCAKKIFEDRMDTDSVQQIMPEYMRQMNLVNRTSLVQQANERTVTIYTTGRQYWGWGGWGPNFPF